MHRERLQQGKREGTGGVERLLYFYLLEGSLKLKVGGEDSKNKKKKQKTKKKHPQNPNHHKAQMKKEQAGHPASERQSRQISRAGLRGDEDYRQSHGGLGEMKKKSRKKWEFLPKLAKALSPRMKTLLKYVEVVKKKGKKINGGRLQA